MHSNKLIFISKNNIVAGSSVELLDSATSVEGVFVGIQDFEDQKIVEQVVDTFGAAEAGRIGVVVPLGPKLELLLSSHNEQTH